MNTNKEQKIIVTTKSMQTACGRKQKIDETTINAISCAGVSAVSLAGKAENSIIFQHRQCWNDIGENINQKSSSIQHHHSNTIGQP